MLKLMRLRERERERESKHSPFRYIFFVWLGVISLVFQNLFLFSSSLMVKAEEPKTETKQEEKSELLQFTSNGSVVGFNNDGVIVASKDKALKIGFVDSNKITPTQESSTVTYTSLWEGVNVTYEQTPDSIFKSTYYLDNPNKVDSIQLHYNRPITLDNKGNLIIKFETGVIKEQAPTAYQQTPQGKHKVTVSFSLHSNNTVGFTISNFLPNLPLIIDPALTWNTFLGGSGTDQGQSITLDSSGNIYVTGYSNATWGTPVRAYTSSFDIFVIKLNDTGNLVWNTFLGGSGIDFSRSITLDSSGNIYLGGYSNATWGTPVRAYTLGSDVFVAKLEQNGNLTWNTFLGGSGNDDNYTVSLDTGGNIYLGGYSNATWGTPVRVYTSGIDTFIAKIDNDGVLAWNTFLGGSGDDYAGYSNSLDTGGNIYLGGYSNATWGTPVRAYTSNYDAYVVKLDSSGNLTWNTFLGGSNIDYTYSVTSDSNQNIYLIGRSSATWGTPVRAYTSGIDILVAKLDSSGNLTWNTFLGGGGGDSGFSITLDTSRNIFVAGNSSATWGTPVRAYLSGDDASISKLDNNGNLTWNTFLGGGGGDYTYSVVLDNNENVYVGGRSDATWGSPIGAFSSGIDIGVVKLEGYPSSSSVAGSVGDSGTTISWTTDIVSSSKVDYGTTTSYGSSTTETDTSTRVTSHSVTLSGLSSCTTYHYRVKSKDVGETEGVSGDYSFVSQGCSGSPNTPETYQVSGEVLQTTTTETVLSPTKDSNQEEQKVVAILPPQTFNFNAFLSSQVTNIIYSGNLTPVGKVQEIWYKAYAPEGYTPQRIVPSLQTKPSIVSLSYTGTYKNLKIAYSPDGKSWKVLPNSVIDPINKTVAVITKLGGYYTLVAINSSTSETPVLETNIKSSPSPTPLLPVEQDFSKQETQTTINKIIDFFKNIINSIGK